MRQRTILTRSVLLAGPHGVGKTFLVHAICNHLGATLFDLSSASLMARYPGKAGMNMLIHLVTKVTNYIHSWSPVEIQVTLPGLQTGGTICHSRWRHRARVRQKIQWLRAHGPETSEKRNSKIGAQRVHRRPDHDDRYFVCSMGMWPESRYVKRIFNWIISKCSDYFRVWLSVSSVWSPYRHLITARVIYFGRNSSFVQPSVTCRRQPSWPTCPGSPILTRPAILRAASLR